MAVKTLIHFFSCGARSQLGPKPPHCSGFQITRS